jgi:hypothetical protein
VSKIIFVVAVISFLCGFSSLFPVPVVIAMEEGSGEYRPSAFMVIEAKTRHTIVASKRRFEIMRETRILDRRGREISIQNLPVPCKAQVDYETFSFGDPIAIKILIKKVFPGASTDWADSMPE